MIPSDSLVKAALALVGACLFTGGAVLADGESRLAAADAEKAFPAPAKDAAAAFPSDPALLKAVTPAVVSVFPAQLVRAGEDGSPLDRFFGKSERGGEGGDRRNAAEKENERIQGVGSGVILAADGWIVTNSHVVHFENGKLADAVSVELADHRVFDAEIVGVDAPTDLALLKIDASGLTRLPLADSEAVEVGDPVFAVGNPFKIGTTATKGMISAVRRSNLAINGESGYESYLQTDAPINPGNSGGALVNARGELAGVNAAIYGPARGNVGIGFAISANLVRWVVRELAQHGSVTRGFFGLQSADLSRAEAASAGLEAVAGARIASVAEGGPAAAAGLVQGDVILTAGGLPVVSRGDLRVILSMHRPGDALAVEYWRDRGRHAATIKAAASPAAGGGAAAAGGLELAALPGVKFKLDETGLSIAAVPRSAAKTGLATGMVVTAINGTEIHSLADAESALKTGVNRIETKTADGAETLAVRLPLR